MKMKLTFAIVLTAAVLGLGAPVQARQPCTPEVNGACFIPLAVPPDALSFQLFDAETGWLLTVTYTGDGNWLSLLPNATARIHINDHDAILAAINLFTGDLAAGVGRTSVNVYWEVALGVVLCPAVVTVAGDVGGRWVDATFQSTSGNPGGDSPVLGPPPQDGCYVKENSVTVY